MLGEFRARPPQPPMQPQQGASLVHLVPWKQLISNDKPLKEPTVYFFDISTTSATLASKHGNNIIRIWSVGSGEVQNNLKINCYTTAQARSREYFVRSHAILSEPSNLIAIAAGFGDSLEIWDWGKKKRLQTMDSANRWAAVRSNVMEAGWCPLVTYSGESDRLDLYSTTHNPKKPFKKTRSIDLRSASLPIIPKFPELAFSATGPLLVTASGPRPPRPFHPPPERETLLTAWEIHDGAPLTPYKVVAPWQHSELDTALPSGLATYGSVAVSIWIPASYRAIPIPADRGGRGGFNLAPVTVPYRHVLIWDFSASSTKTFRIPNATSCVSPDCRFVAYCDSSGVESGARGCLALLDAMTGRQLWCWPDPDAGMMSSRQEEEEGGMQGKLADLSRVTEMCFSADGGFLFVGDADGGIGVFEVREGEVGAAGEGREVGLRALR
jgi:WD40 repeat protein